MQKIKIFITTLLLTALCGCSDMVVVGKNTNCSLTEYRAATKVVAANKKYFWSRTLVIQYGNDEGKINSKVVAIMKWPSGFFIWNEDRGAVKINVSDVPDVENKPKILAAMWSVENFKNAYYID